MSDPHLRCTLCGAEMISLTSGMTCTNGCGRLHPKPSSFHDVIPPGTRAITGDGIDCIVVSVTVHAGHRLTYRVVHWRDGHRIEIEVEDFEITTDHPVEPLRIGFVDQSESLIESEQQS